MLSFFFLLCNEFRRVKDASPIFIPIIVDLFPFLVVQTFIMRDALYW